MNLYTQEKVHRITHAVLRMKMITTSTPIAHLQDNTARIGFLAAALKEQLARTATTSSSTASPPHTDDVDVEQVLMGLKAKEHDDYVSEMKDIMGKHGGGSSSSSGGGANTIPPLTDILQGGVLGGGSNSGSRQLAFPFFSQNPTHAAAQQAFTAFAKAHEIQLRFNDISSWDETHGKVLELLTDNNSRDSLGIDEYKKAIRDFGVWCSERGFELPTQQDIRGRRALCQSSLPMAQQPGLTLTLFYSCPALSKDDEDTTPKKVPNPSSPTATEDDMLAMTIATALPHRVDARVLFQKYVKSISVVKTEAELIMCDGDGDGRVTMAELETYIGEIIPTVATLQHMPPDMVPFYTCSSTRRIFWLLDPTSRGTIKVSSLINHPVMDDWLEVQMMAEEQTRNWFGVTIAMQLREKFEILDINGVSALDLECMKRYKKGIPMVVDDGLPKDISPLSSLFLERAFDVMQLPQAQMDYASFVDFVVAVEFLPASCPRPLFFWRIFDIFGEGRITPLVVHSFFKETYAKLKSAEVEVAAIDIIVQELFDLIPSKEPLVILKDEFINAKQCGLFSALVVDCLAFYTYENREQK